MAWTVLSLCGLGMRSCPMAFSWCGLGLTARGWFGLFGAVGVLVFTCIVYTALATVGGFSTLGHYDAR